MRKIFLIGLICAATAAAQIVSMSIGAPAFAGVGLNGPPTSGGVYVGVRQNHQYGAQICVAGTPDTVKTNRDNGSYTGCVNMAAALKLSYPAGSITAATWTGGIATYTDAGHGLTSGALVTITGASAGGYNVTNATVTVFSSSQFTVPIATNPGTWTSGGAVVANDGITVTWPATTGHTVGDAWSVGVNGVTASGQSMLNAVGAVVRTQQAIDNETISALGFAGADWTGTTDSTTALINCIAASEGTAHPCTIPYGQYLISSTLPCINGGALVGRGSGGSGFILPVGLFNAPTLVMNANNMTAINAEGYNCTFRGFNITRSTGLTGGVGILIDTSNANRALGSNNTSGVVLDDLYISAGYSDVISGNLLTAGILIQGSAVGEVVYTDGHRVHVQGAIDAWKDTVPALEYQAGYQDNDNSCDDCNLENSARCLHLNGVGEAHFFGLSLNGCNGIPQVGSILLTNGSTAVVGTGTMWTAAGAGTGYAVGAPMYAQGLQPTVAGVTDNTHLTLSAPWAGTTATIQQNYWGIGQLPIVIDGLQFSGGYVPSNGNQIKWNSGEPVSPVAIFSPYTERNVLEATDLVPLGGTVFDMTGGKNSVLAHGGNFVASYDVRGFPQLWVGQVGVHTATAGALSPQFATFQISETSPAGFPGTGNNDIFRVQRAATPTTQNPFSGAYLDFNPYMLGLYLQGGPAYQGPMATLDSRAGSGGGINLDNGGQPFGNVLGQYYQSCCSPLTMTSVSAFPALAGAGTITLTSGSTAVTGSGTAFIAGNAGQVLFVNNQFYALSAWSSSTSITLAANYPGTTQSGLAYSIMAPVADFIADRTFRLHDATGTGCDNGHELGLYSTAYAGSTESKLYWCGRNSAGTATSVLLADVGAPPAPLATPFSVQSVASTAPVNIFTNSQNGATPLVRWTSQLIPPLGTYSSAYTELDLYNQGTAGYLPMLVLNSLGLQVPPVPATYGLSCEVGTWVSGNPPSGGTEGTLNYVPNAGSTPGYIEACINSGLGTAAEVQLATGAAITALTGDCTATGPGSVPCTLASVGSTGSCGDTTHTCALTFDAKGRETARANDTIASVTVTAGTGLSGGGSVAPGGSVTLTNTAVPLSGTTGSIGGGALAAGACASGTASVAGATTSMVAFATAAAGADPTNAGALGVSIDALILTSGTVTVRVCPPIAGTPAAATYNVRVIQ